MNLRDEFEKWFPVPENAHWVEQVSMYGLMVPDDVGSKTWLDCYDYNARWHGWLAAYERWGKDAQRYQWLRSQPNDTVAPRIDVVRWEPDDESANSGVGLRLEVLDAAVDAENNPTKDASEAS